MREVDRLTRPQRLVLEALRRRSQEGSPPPTYRELCAEFRWRSTGTVRDHLRALERKGYIELAGRRARQVRLLEEPLSVARVPLVGRVAAGAPTCAKEFTEGSLPVPATWVRRGHHYALIVSGDSMEYAGILNGDAVIVKRQTIAADGDIVVATLDGETTLKRLRHRGERVVLVAENPAYVPMEIRAEAACVQGVVIGLVRCYRTSRYLPRTVSQPPATGPHPGGGISDANDTQE